jgi:hypothetical protein
MRGRVFLSLLLPALVLLLPACGSSESQVTATNPPTTVIMPVETVVVRAYFFRAGHLAAVRRNTVYTRSVGQASIGALVSGTNEAEQKIGFETALSEGTELKRIKSGGGRITIELSQNLSRRARAQVVTTLTQFATVHDVVIVTPRGRTQPLSRADFEDLMPAVLVETPTPFARVRSPLEVSGTSNTFEAISQLELLDASGKPLTSQTVSASSGTGTRGTFRVSLRFQAPPGPATLVSYENSAKDGSRIDVVRIPVQISG